MVFCVKMEKCKFRLKPFEGSSEKVSKTKYLED
jgi:hypothetical protein